MGYWDIPDKNYRDIYCEKFEKMKQKLIPVTKDLKKSLISKCQDNPWLMVGGVDFEDDPYYEADYPYVFYQTDDIRVLKRFFEHGNWSIRQGIVYKDLVFINQVNGGDEWWTLKKDGTGWLAFESITFRRIIKDSEFTKYIRRLLNATLEQCRTLDY